MTKRLILLWAFIWALFSALGFAQSNPSCSLRNPTVTAATPQQSFNNTTSNPTCNTWALTWSVTGFTAVTIQIEGSDDNASWTAYSGGAVIVGTNPSTALSGVIKVAPSAKLAYVRANVVSLTGSGNLQWQLYGYSGTSASLGTAGGGGGGGVTSVLATLPLQSSGGTNPTISIAAAQGNGSKVQLSTGSTTANDCVKFDANGNTVDAGAACGSGGSPAFNTITSGSNNSAAMVVANGATLNPDGYGGVVNANRINFQALPTYANVLKTNGSGQILASGIQGNGLLAQLSTGSFTSGHCVMFDANGNTVDSGGTCGGGGAPSFSSLTSGTNLAAAMLVGTGASLAPTGSGTLSANQINGLAVPASATVVGTNSSNQLIAASLQGNGSKVQLSTGSPTANNCAKFDASGNIIDAGTTCGGGGSGVTSVTATAPITSSGGTTPNISASYQGNGSKIQLSTGSTTTGNCVKFDANGNVIDAGAPCSSGGSSAFSSLTSGTNTTAAMVVGSGASLTASGSGTLNANQVNGGSVPASATVLGSNGSNQPVAASLQGNGSKVQLSSGTTSVNDCVKYDASGNVIDSGTPCGTVTTVTATAPLTSTGGATPNISAAYQGNGSKIQLSSGSTTTNDCVKFDANGNAVDSGAACGSSTPAFSAITSGTNTTAAMVVGSGASLAPTGTGTINANQINGGSVPASATVLGSNSSNQPVAASLQGNGSKVQLSTGSTTSGDCVKFDANGNTVDAGAACGTGGGGSTNGTGMLMFTSLTASPGLTGSATTNKYAPVYGTIAVSGTESNVQSPIAAAGAISNLNFHLYSSIGVGQTVVATLRNAGVATALTCTITGSASVVSCSDSTHSVSVSANDLIDFQLSITNGTISSSPLFTVSAAYTATTPGNAGYATGTTAAKPACSATTKGLMYYATDSPLWYGCDGSNTQAYDGALPVTPPGSLAGYTTWGTSGTAVLAQQGDAIQMKSTSDSQSFGFYNASTTWTTGNIVTADILSQVASGNGDGSCGPAIYADASNYIIFGVYPYTKPWFLNLFTNIGGSATNQNLNASPILSNMLLRIRYVSSTSIAGEISTDNGLSWITTAAAANISSFSSPHMGVACRIGPSGPNIGASVRGLTFQ